MKSGAIAMAKRNFSMIEYFNRVAAEHTPELAFQGKTKKDWQTWRRKARRKYMELLGKFPKPAALDAEVVYSIEDDGLIREKVSMIGGRPGRDSALGPARRDSPAVEPLRIRRATGLHARRAPRFPLARPRQRTRKPLPST